jgi:hypothetical protein
VVILAQARGAKKATEPGDLLAPSVGAAPGIIGLWNAKGNFMKAKAECKKEYPAAVDYFRWHPFTWP